MLLGQYIRQRDNYGWRIPKPGTKSRMIYGLVIYGLQPCEIAKEMGITTTVVHQALNKIVNPKRANMQARKMPTPTAEEPLQKVTMNFFRSDIEYLQRVYEGGWSSAIRMIVREYVEKRKERYNDKSNN